MKKAVIIIVSFLLLLAIPASVFVVMKNQELRKKAAPATTISITPASLTKAAGENFTLEVRMNTADNQIVAVELDITYDAAILEAEWIHNGTMFPNILSSGVVENGKASIALGAQNTTTPVTGTGTVATIKFKALAATTAPITIRFGPNTFVGALGEGSTNALTSSSPATITITGNVTPSPTSALTPTLTPTREATNSATPSAITIDQPVRNESFSTGTPTFQGTAPPGTTVTITVYSDPITATVTTDQNGNWSYTVSKPIDSGPHTVVVAAVDPNSGQSHTATLAFVVSSGDENGASGSAIPVSGHMEYTLLLLGLGASLMLSGVFVSHTRRVAV